MKNPLMFFQCRPPGDHTLGLFYLTVSQVTVLMTLLGWRKVVEDTTSKEISY